MKVNYFYWEKNSFYFSIIHLSIFDTLYGSNIKKKIDFKINSLLLSTFLENSSNYEVFETCLIVNSFSLQRPTVFFKQIRFKGFYSIVFVTLRRNNFALFYYYYFTILQPLLKIKHIKMSKKIDTNGNFKVSLKEINNYLHLGFKYKIFDWDNPIQLNFKTHFENQEKGHYNFFLFNLVI